MALPTGTAATMDPEDQREETVFLAYPALTVASEVLNVRTILTADQPPLVALEDRADETGIPPVADNDEKKVVEEAGPKVVALVSEEEPKEKREDDELAAESNVEEEQEKNAAKEVGSVVQKSSSFKEESYFLSDLKDHERKALLELRIMVEDAILSNEFLPTEDHGDAKVEVKASDDVSMSLWGVPLPPSKDSNGTDVVFLKFLRARDFKVREAFEMLRSTLFWRKDTNVDSILEEEALGEGLEAAAYMDGIDREGHPVCYNVYKVFQDREIYDRAFGSEEKVERFLRWRFQLMERWIQKLDLRPGGVASMLQITDLKDAPGVTKKELRSAMKRAVGLLQDNYPEFVAKNIFINVPFWYYAFNSILSPFLTQRTKSKFIFSRPAGVAETLLKYIPAEDIPVCYGGLKRANDSEFSVHDGGVYELIVKSGSIECIEIPVEEVGTTLVWDLTVLGWEVNYKEEFVPTDEGSYTILLQKGKKMGSQEEAVRNSFRIKEPGKVVLIIENTTYWKKRVLYRYKTKQSS